MTEQSTFSTVGGWLVAIATVAVPLGLWHTGIYPLLMLGAAAGGGIRIITDWALARIRTDDSASGMEQFDAEHVPIVAIAVLLQMGTLLLSIPFALMRNALAIGYAVGMGISYLLAIVVYAIKHGGEATESETTDADGGEEDEDLWKFDPEDFEDDE